MPPKLTALAPVKSVPVMVTAVPPVVGPELGLTPVTVGGADVGELVVGRVGRRGAPGGGDRRRRPSRAEAEGWWR